FNTFFGAQPFASLAFRAFANDYQLCRNSFLNAVKNLDYVFHPFYFPKIAYVRNDPFFPICHHIALAIGKWVYFFGNIDKVWNHVDFLFYVEKMQGIILQTLRNGSYHIAIIRSEEHTSELQSRENLVC